MAYSPTIAVLLPTMDVGLTLEAVLFDEDGVQVGLPIATGFDERGNGAYQWKATIPDDFRGVAIFREVGDPTVRAEVAINPEQIELITQIFDLLGGGGSNTVNFTVQNTDLDPVVGAYITIKQGGVIVYWTRSGVGGLASMALDPGNYTYTVTAGSAYVQQVDQAFTVDSDPEAVTVTLVPQASGPPAAAGLCTVHFYCTLNGRPQENMRIKARLIDLNSATEDELLSLQVDEALSNEVGEADLELVQGGQFTKGNGVYEITVMAPAPDNTVTHKIQVAMPDLDEVNFEDLLP